MKKRLFSGLLALVLLLTLLPTAAFAAEGPEQQFDLDIGTYYFDLSGETLPGTVNTALPNGKLPDGTLHYVPFVYEGTINAYVLNEKSSDVSDSSAKAAAATDPDADYGYRYDHSLFMADFHVTHAVSWEELNGAHLIFGRTYASGGVDYTLRAPTSGSAYSREAITVTDCTPTSNEWYTLPVMPRGDNWGWAQDTAIKEDDPSTEFRMGFCCSLGRRDLTVKSKSSESVLAWGFRPVLEVPGTLASDALKAVTLDLNGGSVDDKENISIIVKNGASYSAPSDTGLTRPKGNTLTYFVWLGDNGETYAPGDSVPAEVTALTAQWVDGVVVGDFVVKGGVLNEDYEYQESSLSNVLGVLTGTPLTISMKPGVESTDASIQLAASAGADITLAGVSIISPPAAPLDFAYGGDSKLTLADGTINTLNATTGSFPGIHTGTAKLTIDGGGQLDVYGSTSCAGIGSYADSKETSSIVINGGVINAYGGAAVGNEANGGAGIGSGRSSYPSNITINGGTIYAEGGGTDTGNASAGAGIGSGGRSVGSSITINGGTVTAQGGTAPYGAGAGIGGGGHSADAESITITGGVITAIAGANGAAGIGGGGHGGKLKSLSITGGFITATGTYKGNDPSSAAPGNANAIGGGAAEDPADLSAVRGAVIIDGRTGIGSVYGSAVLKQTAKVPADVTLTIPEDASLTVGAGGTLTNEGLIKAEGTLTKNGGGTITNNGNGEIWYSVTWDLTNANHTQETSYASTRNKYSAVLLCTIEGHTLPDSIRVIVDGTTLTSGYTYNKDSGNLSIDAASITGNVVITDKPLSSGATYYTVTASAGAGGSISPSGAVSVRKGRDKTFTITPEDGYAIGDVLLDGVSVKTELTGGSYTIKNITRRHSLSVTFVKSGQPGPFTDVKGDDWFLEDVLYVYENKLMLGTSATTFSPHAPTTRGMLVTILYGLAGSPSIEDEIWGYPFADVDVEEYYGTAVYWARLNGVVGGYDAEHFGPNDPVTREQLAAILYRYAQYKGYDVSVGEDANILSYSDIAEASEWAIPALQWACGSGLLQGSDGKLMPRGSAERCQVAAILQQFCENFINP